jgi:hypothetical protein
VLLKWAPPAGGQALTRGMPPWRTPVPQSQWPSYSSPTVSHLCLLSIVPFVIRANVKWLAYSFIYVFKCPSLLTRHDFADTVLNMGGSDEGDSGGIGNDAAPWSSCAMCCICVIKWWRTMYCCVKTIWIVVVIYMSWTSIVIVLLSVCALFWKLPIRGGSQNKGYIKKPIYCLVNRGTYVLIFLD